MLCVGIQTKCNGNLNLMNSHLSHVLLWHYSRLSFCDEEYECEMYLLELIDFCVGYCKDKIQCLATPAFIRQYYHDSFQNKDNIIDFCYLSTVVFESASHPTAWASHSIVKESIYYKDVITAWKEWVIYFSLYIYT